MKRSRNALIAVLLSCIIFLSFSLIPSAAFSDSFNGSSIGETIARNLQNKLNRIIDLAGKGLVYIIPDSVLVKNSDEFVADESFSGTGEFISSPADGAKWSLGYSQASILPEDFGTGTYYKGGYALNKKVTECLDDLNELFC